MSHTEIQVQVPLVMPTGEVGPRTLTYDPRAQGWTAATTLTALKQALAHDLGIPVARQRLCATSGLALPDHCLFVQEAQHEAYWACRMALTVCGGKGGFGSMLRAQGGKMSSHKTTNFDACRDLAGRRIKSKKMADAILESMSEEEKRKADRRFKVQKKIRKGLEEQPPKRHLFDDPNFFKNTEKMGADVKHSVQAALKSATHAESASSTTSSSSTLAAPADLGRWDALPDLSDAEESATSKSG
ncbi:hypothetical protein H4R34_000213 [Dimargaris verticillata]|uniref:SDE2-like domain-containing protein n=1 Tax=Dimargaris verticillata TaxID=2761393 RepID=A0A9W8B6P3_9FUNG|nr:hypothetical protein H4R34_000213 [Dimargaris verticillata]